MFLNTVIAMFTPFFLLYGDFYQTLRKVTGYKVLAALIKNSSFVGGVLRALQHNFLRGYSYLFGRML